MNRLDNLYSVSKVKQIKNGIIENIFICIEGVSKENLKVKYTMPRKPGCGRKRKDPIKCTICDKEFAKPWKYNRHYKLSHSNSNKYEKVVWNKNMWECKICKNGREWTNKGSFKRHLCTFHTGKQIYRAGYPIKKYFIKYNYTKALK